MNFNEAQVLKSSTELESKNKNVMIKYLENIDYSKKMKIRKTFIVNTKC